MSELYYLSDMDGEKFMDANGDFCPKEEVESKLMLSFRSPQDADRVSDYLN